MDCRIPGVDTPHQTEKNGDTYRNDRFIAVLTVAQPYDAIETLENLPKQMIDELIHFFKAYKEMAGEQFEPLESRGEKR